MNLNSYWWIICFYQRKMFRNVGIKHSMINKVWNVRLICEHAHAHVLGGTQLGACLSWLNHPLYLQVFIGVQTCHSNPPCFICWFWTRMLHYVCPIVFHLASRVQRGMHGHNIPQARRQHIKDFILFSSRTLRRSLVVLFKASRRPLLELEVNL